MHPVLHMFDNHQLCKSRLLVNGLRPATMQHQQESLCNHLSSIRPQKHIAPFLHACSEDGLPWNPQQALQFSSKLNMPQL